MARKSWVTKDLADEWIEIDEKEIWSKFKRAPRINRLLETLKKHYALAVLSDTIDSKQEKIEKMRILGINHEILSLTKSSRHTI